MNVFTGSKKGSALLIVLGMVSFMIISAVSFAIYMRQSRAPSSYVRRNTSTRLLLKAALARAIDEIDTAIGNDPYPGVGRNAKSELGTDTATLQTNAVRTINRWIGRVFTPTNEVPSDDTVATLSLEGLGYLPAPLLNEVRYGSRHTPTATWRSFNYDMGRYAFTAVNVSDYFDINVVKADQPRTSQQPITLGPLFMDDDYSSFDIKPNDWDTELFSEIGTTDPLNRFYSLMDFNLVLGNKLGNALGVIKSPFYTLLRNGGSGSIYDGTTEEDARRQLFVTDSYFPSTTTSGTDVDISQEKFQPFYGCSGFPESATLQSVMDHDGAFWNPIGNRIPIASMALLADYLDYDSVPLSLCLPCTEVAPMIMGLEYSGELKVTVSAPNDNGDRSPEPSTENIGEMCSYTRTYGLTVEARPTVTVSVVFPFKRTEDRVNSKSYTVDVYARLFFTPGSSSELRYTGSGAFAQLALNNEKWRTETAAQVAADNTAIEFFGTQNVTIDTKVETQKDVINNIQSVDVALSAANNLAVTLFKKKYEAQIVASGEGAAVQYSSESAKSVDETGFRFMAANWDLVSDIAEDDSKVYYRPAYAVWVRIKDANGDTVDCVPATSAYDALNGNSYTDSRFQQGVGNNAGTPLLRFSAKESDANNLVLNKGWLRDKDGQTVDMPQEQFAQRAYIACDPRYNWAPEDWRAYDAETNPKTEWPNLIGGYLGNGGRDTDVFIAVSDRGFLQSPYELMMIPQIKTTKDGGGGDATMGLLMTAEYNGAVRTGTGGFANDTLMWRTYRCRAFDTTWDPSDDPSEKKADEESDYAKEWGLIDNLPFANKSSVYRVNPFADSSVLKSVFVNTPFDWWAAASNHLSGATKRPTGEGVKDKTWDDAKTALDYTFGPKYSGPDSDSTKWDRDDLNDIMDTFTTRMAAEMSEEVNYKRGAAGWTNAFDSISWSGTGNARTSYTQNNDPLYEIDAGASVADRTLSSVDRKYLYGFWKNCFQMEQQLFLVFVRAEPVSQGSGMAGGGRAVALVWRDPNAPDLTQYTSDNAKNYLKPDNADYPTEAWRLKTRNAPPHRTRVLFYHQFD